MVRFKDHSVAPLKYPTKAAVKVSFVRPLLYSQTVKGGQGSAQSLFKTFFPGNKQDQAQNTVQNQPNQPTSQGISSTYDTFQLYIFTNL